MAWPDSGTGESEATIGTAQTHTTIAAWEADTDINCVTGTVSPIGVINVAEEFDEASVTFSGATTNSTYFRKLTVAAAARHDGLTSTGAFYTGGMLTIGQENWFVLEWLGSYLESTGNV